MPIASRHGWSALLVAVLTVYPLPLSPATITVDDATSTVATDGRCSLREAINNANSDSDTTGGDCASGDEGLDTIELLTDIALTAVDNDFDGANGLPLITTDVIVDGNDHVVERDPSVPNFRLFHFVADPDARFAESMIRQVTIKNGTEGVRVEGGARFADTLITITDSVVSGNTGRGVTGEYVILANSMVLGNFDAGIVGYNVDVDNSAIFDNSGWGIRSGGGVVSSSTVSGNQDGGILTGATGRDVRITNSTISGNSGDGVSVGIVGSSATITQSTITRNSGDGVVAYGFFVPADPPLEIAGTIVADNLGENCTSNWTPSTLGFMDRGSNFSDDDSCPDGFEAITGLDPVLADNGGPTKTHALFPGSSAIDAGGDGCPDTDQRGVSRPQDGNDDGVPACDAGAYEYLNQELAVDIDIKPDGFPNSVNPKSRGVIPVAILGNESFDVANIDEATLRFGPDAAPIAHRHAHFEDANLDGVLDLITHYRTQDTGIVCGNESVTLTGKTLDGQPFEGTDSIQTVGCQETRRPAIWMKDMDRPDTIRRGGPVDIERR
jgi:hypothetical protein